MLNSLVLLRQEAKRNIESVYKYDYKHLDSDYILKAISFQEGKLSIDGLNSLLAITPLLVFVGLLAAKINSGLVGEREGVRTR